MLRHAHSAKSEVYKMESIASCMSVWNIAQLEPSAFLVARDPTAKRNWPPSWKPFTAAVVVRGEDDYFPTELALCSDV